MADILQGDFDAVAAKLNSGPRKSLGYDTPAGRLSLLLHSPVESKPRNSNKPHTPCPPNEGTGQHLDVLSTYVAV